MVNGQFENKQIKVFYNNEGIERPATPRYCIKEPTNPAASVEKTNT